MSTESGSVQNLGADAIRNMYKLSKQITDIDSSWSYKFGGQHYREKMDKKREALFEGLSRQVDQNLHNQSAPRLDGW